MAILTENFGGKWLDALVTTQNENIYFLNFFTELLSTSLWPPPPSSPSSLPPTSKPSGFSANEPVMSSLELPCLSTCPLTTNYQFTA